MRELSGAVWGDVLFVYDTAAMSSARPRGGGGGGGDMP